MAQQINITRARGDTYRLRITFTKDDGSPLDFTNSTVKMTVSEIASPDLSGGYLFQIAGSVVAPATDGVCDFILTTAQADNVGLFYYDVEMIDVSGAVRTILVGQFLMEQDITKSDTTFEWTPPTTPNDGDPAIVDGSLDWNAFASRDVVATYETRDTRRVIRDGHVPTALYQSTGWQAKGPDIPRHEFQGRGWEWQITLYMNLSLLGLDFGDAVIYHSIWTLLNNMSGTPDASGGGGTIQNTTLGYLESIAGYPAPDTTGWTDDDWFKIGFRILADGTVEYQIKREADADNWLTIPSPYLWSFPVSPVWPTIWTRRVFPHNAASVIDLWKYEWRKL